MSTLNQTRNSSNSRPKPFPNPCGSADSPNPSQNENCCQLHSSSWEITIVRERANVLRRAKESPTLAASMRDIPDAVYREARREAEIETKLPRSAFPAECPYTVEQLLQDDWLP
jgi:hypothetical protein